MKSFKIKYFALIWLLLISVNGFAQNLLVNPDAETGTTEGWVDPDNAWGTSAVITPHEGDHFFWPSKLTIPYTQMYQDVDVSNYSSDSYFHLSGWLANWDQAPHDKATLAIAAFDANGNQLFYGAREHRNPAWGYYEIISQLPEESKILRVYLIATRYVGSDNDGYFDELSLIINNDAPNISVSISSEGDKKEIEIEKTLQLSATTIGGSDSAYAWSSSYDGIGTVDENGLVTAVSPGTFTIQAIGKNTQAVGYITLVSHAQSYIMFTNPVGEEEWDAGRSEKLTWDVVGDITSATLYWSLNDGVDWEEIGAVNTSSGEYMWTVPSTDKALNNCLLKLVWNDGETISSRFSIVPATGVEKKNEMPKDFSLSQNYPNPFNPSTVIEFSLPQASNVTLTIYNNVGQKVKELIKGVMSEGIHSVNFNASNLSNGIYFYRISAQSRNSNFIQTRKMILLK